MASLDSNPPSYLRDSQSNISDPFTSPPRRKTRFTSHAASSSSVPSASKHYNYAGRESLFPESEALPPPASLILPPPAITSYAYAPSASSWALQRSPLHSLQQQTKHITEEIQVLLDAQSTALMSGGSFSATKSTSTSIQGTKKLGKKKIISLQEARSGVLRAMRALAEIKDVEEDVYASQAADREELVKTVESWGKKTKMLEGEIHTIEEGEDGKRAEALREEKSELENELYQLRLHLSELETKHSTLSTQLLELESTISSKTSSYQASLTSLKQKTAKFLSTHRYASPSTAIESWTLEREALDEKRQQARVEGDALRDGIIMWEDALSLVSGFEDKLRARVMPSAITRGERSTGEEEDVKQKIMRDIEDVIDKLEQRLRLAEGRGWKLLVCCVGAELQVFLEAREMMQRNLGTSATKSSSTPKDFDDGGSQHDEHSAPESRKASSRSRLGSGLGNGLGSITGSSMRTLSAAAPLRKTVSPAEGNISLLDRSDDGNDGDVDEGGGEEERSIGELLLKVDNVGDGAKDLPDYSPLDD